MINYIENFIYSFSSPFNSYKEKYQLSLVESIAMTWIVKLISGIVQIFVLNLVLLYVIQSVQIDISFIDFSSYDRFTGFYFFIFSIFLDLIFYPLFCFVYYEFWLVIIKPFVILEDRFDESFDDQFSEIISRSISAQFLTIIPFIGNFLNTIISLAILFAGLRSRFKFSITLSLLMILMPMFIALFFTAFIITLVIL